MRLQVVDWEKTYENNRSREVIACRFVCVPNKFGIGLTKILSQPDGLVIYAVWCLLLGYLSRQNSPRGGYLTDDGSATGKPIPNEEFAMLWRCQESQVDRAFSFICKIGWVQELGYSVVKSDDAVPTICRPSADVVTTQCRRSDVEGKGIEEKRKEGRKGTADSPIPTAPPKFTPADVDEIIEAYPNAGRSGIRAAKYHVQRALTEVHLMGEPDPKGMLLAKVKEYAESDVVKCGKVMGLKRFWEDGHYEDDPEVWRDRTDASAGASAGKPGPLPTTPGGLGFPVKDEPLTKEEIDDMVKFCKEQKEGGGESNA